MPTGGSEDMPTSRFSSAVTREEKCIMSVTKRMMNVERTCCRPRYRLVCSLDQQGERRGRRMTSGVGYLATGIRDVSTDMRCLRALSNVLKHATTPWKKTSYLIDLQFAVLRFVPT